MSCRFLVELIMTAGKINASVCVSFFYTFKCFLKMVKYINYLSLKKFLLYLGFNLFMSVFDG